MSDNKTTISSGIGLGGLLGTAFIVLKLCHVIDWPWVWVLAPFWGPLAIVLGFLALAGVCFLGAWILGKK
jgi:hypothetical protein